MKNEEFPTAGGAILCIVRISTIGTVGRFGRSMQRVAPLRKRTRGKAHCSKQTAPSPYRVNASTSFANNDEVGRSGLRGSTHRQSSEGGSK